MRDLLLLVASEFVCCGESVEQHHHCRLMFAEGLLKRSKFSGDFLLALGKDFLPDGQLLFLGIDFLDQCVEFFLRR